MGDRSLKPHLVFYSYDFQQNPWCGGGGAYRDFEVLRRQGEFWESITLYVGSYPGCRETVTDGLRIIPLGFGRGTYLLSRLTYSLMANLNMLFQRGKVLGNALSIYAPLPAILFFPSRSFLVLHHYVGAQSMRKFGSLGVIAYIAEQVMLRGLRHALVSNRMLAEKIRKLNGKAKLLKTTNGFDETLLERKAVEKDFILFMGRFDVYMKGIDLLVKGFAKAVTGRDKGMRLILAGRSSPATQAEVIGLVEAQKLGSQVEVLTNISDDKKKELLSSCLFFCSPSRFEGWGIAALEANAAGKAVLVTETDGFLDSIARDKSGLFIPVENEEALVQGLKMFMDDAELRHALGRGGREWARTFTWESIARREGEWLRSSMAIGSW